MEAAFQSATMVLNFVVITITAWFGFEKKDLEYFQLGIFLSMMAMGANFGAFNFDRDYWHIFFALVMFICAVINIYGRLKAWERENK